MNKVRQIYYLILLTAFTILWYVLLQNSKQAKADPPPTATPVIIQCINHPGEGDCGDTFIADGNSDQNYGNRVQMTLRDRRRFFLRFSQAKIEAALPAGFSLMSAKVGVYQTAVSSWYTGGTYFDMHRMLSDWTEGEGGCSGCQGTTWSCLLDTNTGNSLPNCTTQWDGGSAGTDYVALYTDTKLYESTSPEDQFVEWDVSADIPTFLSDGYNYGWMWKNRSEFDPGNLQWATRENTTAAQRPYLALYVEENTPTPEHSDTPTITPTHTFTVTPTITDTPTITNTPILTSTPTLTFTVTPTVTDTPTITNTPTRTYTQTPTVTNTPTVTPTITNTPTNLPSFTPRPNQVGDEEVVNTSSTYAKGFPYIFNTTNEASGSQDGNVVITWMDLELDGGSPGGIFARRADRDLAFLGSDFQVNTYTTGFQIYPEISGNREDGTFTVQWNSGQDSAGSNIWTQRFTSAGTAIGTEYQSNTDTLESIYSAPHLAERTDDTFVSVWPGNSVSALGVDAFGARFNSSGVKVGADFQIVFSGSSFIPNSGNRNGIDVATADSGEFTVVWGGGFDGYGYGIFGQKYTSSGVVNGGMFQVNTFTEGGQSLPAIAMQPGDSGTFVVAWRSAELYGNYIRAQRFTGNAKVGAEFVVTPTGANAYASTPEVCMQNYNNEFLVIWGNEFIDGDGKGVYAQRFSSAGSALGSAFAVNSERNGDQEIGDIGCDGKGRYTMTWGSSQARNGAQLDVKAIIFDFTPPTPTPGVFDENGEGSNCGCRY